MPKHTVVFTDLDGTLLDHHTYQLDAAKPVLAKLKELSIPVVLNTSKTLVEVLEIRTEHQLTAPFIIENGAAVYIPVGYFNEMPEDCIESNGYWCKSFCHERQHWLDLLTQHAHQFSGEYQGFSQLNVEELIVLTGLTAKQAEQALQRDYSEPLHWLGSDETKTTFIEYMSELGAKILHGGRFMHVSGYCDKGQAQQWLLEQYQAEQQLKFPNDDINMASIALGDSGNDIAMLEQATIAVQIKTPVHVFPVLQRTEHVYQSTKYGPEGWAECLTQLLLSK